MVSRSIKKQMTAWSAATSSNVQGKVKNDRYASGRMGQHTCQVEGYLEEGGR